MRYNPDSGAFVRKWRIGKGCRAIDGAVAGWTSDQGYTLIGIGGYDYFAHRLAWLYVYGQFPIDQIDHINHDKSDNRMVNLRAATTQENQQNISIPKTNKSGVVGVSWYKNLSKWTAKIKVDGMSIHLGYFKEFADAVVVRQAANVAYRFHPNHGKTKQELQT